MFSWLKIPKDEIAIEPKAETSTKGPQKYEYAGKTKYKKRYRKEMIAILGTNAKNIVEDVGDPSYTSGDHICNGKAASLNKIPLKTKTIATSKIGWWLKLGDAFRAAISLKAVVPQNP